MSDLICGLLKSDRKKCCSCANRSVQVVEIRGAARSATRGSTPKMLKGMFTGFRFADEASQGSVICSSASEARGHKMQLWKGVRKIQRSKR